MTDTEQRDDDAERSEAQDEETHMEDTSMAENETSNDSEADEEKPVSLDMTYGQAIALYHMAWEKEVELSKDPETAGVAEVMGQTSRQLAKELFGEDVVDWVNEREDEREKMMEQMREQMGGGMGEQQMTDRDIGTFQ